MTNNKIMEIEEKMAFMQRELDALKEAEAKKTPSVSAGIHKRYKGRLEKAQLEVAAILQEMIAEGVELAGIAVLYSKTKQNAVNSNVSVFTTDTLDELDEDGLCAVLDVFTNSRRVTLLKLLINNELTASGITKKSGLIGGQLYHHLSSLENAGLIERAGDKYKARGTAQTLLCGLYTIIGGMDLLRK